MATQRRLDDRFEPPELSNPRRAIVCCHLDRRAFEKMTDWKRMKRMKGMKRAEERQGDSC
jgi:hypothetical protein